MYVLCIFMCKYVLIHIYIFVYVLQIFDPLSRACFFRRWECVKSEFEFVKCEFECAMIHFCVCSDPIESMGLTCAVRPLEFLDSRTPLSCLGHDWFILATWLIQMCVTTHTHIWYDPFMCMTCLMHVTCRIHMCDMPHACDMPHSHVWHASFIHVTLIHTRDMPYSNKCDTLFPSVIWRWILLKRRFVTIFLCYAPNNVWYDTTYSRAGHDSFIIFRRIPVKRRLVFGLYFDDSRQITCDMTRHIHARDMTHSYMQTDRCQTLIGTGIIFWWFAPNTRISASESFTLCATQTSFGSVFKSAVRELDVASNDTLWITLLW